jgi:hypothetical protein
MQRRAGLAAILAVLLLAGCGSSGQRYLVSPGAGASGGPASGSPAPQAIKDFIPVAEKFVEEHRGLKFLKPVPVTFLSDAEFTKKLNSKNQINTEQVNRSAKELEALGLLDGHPDLAKLEQSLLNGAVVGFYDSQDKQLYVRGATLTPYTREVLVHELTHAVQDQHFNISHPELDNVNDERPEALLGLLEGDSVTVENEYVASESPQDQAEALQEQTAGAANIPANIPPVLIQLLIFPYTDGPTFIKGLRDAAGQAAVDKAFTDLPKTTQQILHPERYLAHDAGTAVPKPPADGTSYDDSVLGEQGLDLLIHKAETDGNLDQGVGDAASAAWDGDRYAAWDQSSTVSCVRAIFEARNGSDAAALKRALEEYVGTLPHAALESTSPITIKVCNG